MEQKETKSQHYVPRTYLKHFSCQDKEPYSVGVLSNKDLHPDKISNIGIGVLCAKNDLYTLPGDTKEKRLFIEKFYNEKFETHYDKLYDKLIDPNRSNLTHEERQLLIGTVVSMFLRTTKPFNNFNSQINPIIESAYTLAKEVGKEYFIFSDIRIEIKGKTLEEVQKEFPKKIQAAQVMSQLKVSIDLMELRTERDGIHITKITDDDYEFITCDNPVDFFNFKNRPSMFDSSNILTLPLDNKHLLSLLPISDEEFKHTIVRNDLKGEDAKRSVLVGNYARFVSSERFIFGSETALNKFLIMKTDGDREITSEDIEFLQQHPDIMKQLKDLGYID